MSFTSQRDHKILSFEIDTDSSSSEESSSAFDSDQESNHGVDSTPISLQGKHKHIKWLTLLRNCRKAIKLQRWQDLMVALRSLDTSLRDGKLGIFEPLLSRFVDELTSFLQREWDKEYRRKLTASDAKACGILTKKTLLWKERFQLFLSNMKEKPLPLAVTRESPQVVTAIEELIVIPPHAIINLSHMHLNGPPRILDHLDSVASYYQSFERGAVQNNIACNVTTIDLSYNHLGELPFALLNFANLNTLIISHTRLTNVPAWIVRFQHLTIIEGLADGNTNRKSNKVATLKRIRERLPLSDNLVEQFSLQKLCALAVQAQCRENNRYARSLGRRLAPHLSDIIATTYQCVSCKVISHGQDAGFLQPIRQKMTHVNPPVALRAIAEDNESLRNAFKEAFDSIGSVAFTSADAQQDKVKEVSSQVGPKTRITSGIAVEFRLCVRCAAAHFELEDGLPPCLCDICVEMRRVRSSSQILWKWIAG